MRKFCFQPFGFTNAHGAIWQKIFRRTFAGGNENCELREMAAQPEWNDEDER